MGGTRTGVVNSVVQSLRHLRELGHDCMVIAPGPGPTDCEGTPVVRTASRSIPLYPGFPVGVSVAAVQRALRAFRPDVVHLASPLVLGASGLAAARRLGVPTVAVFQTNVAGFAGHYRQSWAKPLVWSWLRWIHNRATLTLAPSTPVQWRLRSLGFQRVERWGRGVDLDLFHPSHRSRMLRRRFSPNGEWVAGYVGRLAAEKQVHLLGAVERIPNVRLVVVGDGPQRAALQRSLPNALFTGPLTGPELAATYATLDLFVHTGIDETFCQTVQEALASGVPPLVPAAGGPLDLVRHLDNGWLWPPDQPDLLGTIAASLVSDPATHAAVRARTRPSVEGRSWRHLVDELVAHYEAAAEVGLPRMAAA